MRPRSRNRWGMGIHWPKMEGGDSGGVWTAWLRRLRLRARIWDCGGMLWEKWARNKYSFLRSPLFSLTFPLCNTTSVFPKTFLPMSMPVLCPTQWWKSVERTMLTQGPAFGLYPTHLMNSAPCAASKGMVLRTETTILKMSWLHPKPGCTMFSL